MKRLILSLLPVLTFADTIVTTHYRNQSDNNNFIDLVDTDTNTLLRSLPVPQGYGGTDIAITRGAGGRSFAYVVIRNFGDGVFTFGSQNVTVVDVDLQQIVDVITENMIALPNVIAMLPNGKKAYVAGLSGQIAVIDTLTNQVISIPVTGGGSFNTIAATPDGSRVFAISTPGSVYVLDTATDTQVAGSPIVAVSNPSTGSMSTDGQTFFVGNAGSNTITAINTQTLSMQTISTVNVAPNLVLSAVSQDGNYLYMPGKTGTAYVIPTATLLPDPAISLGYNGPVQFIPAPNGYAYLTILPGGQAAQGYYGIFQNQNLLQVNPAGIGDTFGCITSNGAVYLSNYGSDNSTTSLTVISPSSPLASTQVLTGAFTVGLNWIAAAPPSANVAASAQSNQFISQVELYNELSWESPAGIAVASYRIYRDPSWTQLIASLDPSTFIYLDRNLRKNVTYSYYVTYIKNGVEYPLGNTSATP